MELTEQIAMVLAVFALLGGLLWLLKKRGIASLPVVRRRVSGARQMEVLERVPLTPQHAVHLVRVSGKVILIGTAPSSCTILDTAVADGFAGGTQTNILSAGQ
jgi:flagellar biosynthetic protein FliO